MMLRRDILALAVQLICLMRVVEAAKRNDLSIVYTNMTCQALSIKVKTAKCFVSVLNNVTGLSAAFEFHEDLQSVALEALLSVHFEGNRKLKLPHLKFEICNMLKKPPRRNYMQLFYNSFKKAAVNFPKQCPFKKDTSYGTNNLVLDTAIIPVPLSYARLDAIGTVVNENENLIKIFVSGVLCLNYTDCLK